LTEAWEEVILRVQEGKKVEIIIDEAFKLYEIMFAVTYALLGTDLSCGHLLTPEVSLTAFPLNF
jgi:hypothetical protein